MTVFSLIGCQSGKSRKNMRHLTAGQSSRLTAQAKRCLSDIAPRAFEEATQQAAILKVMAELWSLPAISDGLIVRTTFSTSTRCKHYKGRMTLPSLPDSPFFLLRLEETAFVSGQALVELWEIAERREELLGGFIYHVLTSQEIIRAEALPLRVPLSEACRANV